MDEKLFSGIKRALYDYYGIPRFREKFPHHGKLDSEETHIEVKRAVIREFLTFVEDSRGYRICVDKSWGSTPQWHPISGDYVVDELFGVDRAALEKEREEMTALFTELLLDRSIGPRNDG
jgi:hypothetical protein